MSAETTYCDWIAVDWGTSNLRVWAMAQDGTVRAQNASARGMGTLDRSQFEGALLELVEPWLGAGPMSVIACGMVGSRQGWHEAPYAAVPCAPGATPVPVATQDARLQVHILPGLKQETPPDVMRGEETQIAGFLAEDPAFDGVLCLPGTHSKWVRISAGEVVSFQTCMTGELFALLSHSSVLKHSMADDGDAGFEEAISETLSRPEAVGAKLFGIRAADLLGSTPVRPGKARLSGLLIGLELAATRPYWLGQRIALIGAADLTRRYAAALATQGVEAEEVRGDDLVIKGLGAAFQEIPT